MTDSNDKPKETPRPLEAPTAPEAAQKGGVISEGMNQAKWRQTQQQHILEQGESATDLFYDPNFTPKDKTTKFELFDNAEEKTGKFIDYKPQQLDKKTFALGMDHENDPRSGIEKLSDVVVAAARRAGDPAGQEKYLQDEIEKIIGIGCGLNNAKEHTKASVVAGWNALTDGTVATFLTQPNAINDPLFHAIGGAFDAMSKDPHAVNKALEKVGELILENSGRYSKLSPGQQGEALGENLFYAVNPEGSTEAGELALKIADRVATKVDAAVIAGIGKSVKAAQEMAAAAPELGQQAQQMVLDYARQLGLTPQEMEYAGVPREWLRTEVKATNDSYLTMSAEQDGRVYRGDHDVHSHLNTKGRPKSFINEAGDLEPASVEGLYKGEKVTVEEHLAARWCRGAKAHSPFTSFGEKDGVIKTFGQGNGLTLDLAGLRQACANGEVTGIKIIEHQEVLKAIEESRFHDLVKDKLRTWATAHREVVVEGIIPGKFIEVGLK